MGLGGKVHDGVHPFGRQNVANQLGVANVAMHKRVVVGLAKKSDRHRTGFGEKQPQIKETSPAQIPPKKI